jgi:hypothetical protein
MSKKKPKHRHAPTPTPAESQPSVFSNTVLLLLTATLGALLGYAGWQYYHDGSEPRPAVAEAVPTANTSATPAAPTSTPAVTPGTPADPAKAQKLRGKWVRNDSDGKYVLDIKSIGDGGKLEAAYFNPDPINVAKAEATAADGRLRVFVELRDVGYPGSTYDLQYDAGRDQLVGEYFQPALQKRFEVKFDRVK